MKIHPIYEKQHNYNRKFRKGEISHRKSAGASSFSRFDGKNADRTGYYLPKGITQKKL